MLVRLSRFLALSQQRHFAISASPNKLAVQISAQSVSNLGLQELLLHGDTIIAHCDAVMRRAVEDRIVSGLSEPTDIGKRLVLSRAIDKLSAIGYSQSTLSIILDSIASYQPVEALSSEEVSSLSYYYAISLSTLCRAAIRPAAKMPKELEAKVDALSRELVRKAYSMCTTKSISSVMRTFGKWLSSLLYLKKMNRNVPATNAMINTILNTIIREFNPNFIHSQQYMIIQAIWEVEHQVEDREMRALCQRALKPVLLNYLMYFKWIPDSRKLIIINYGLRRQYIDRQVSQQTQKEVMDYLFSRKFSELSGRDLSLLGKMLTNAYIFRRYIGHSGKRWQYLSDFMKYLEGSTVLDKRSLNEIRTRYSRVATTSNLI